MPSEGNDVVARGLDRLTLFSDALFAIIMTLIAVDLKVPPPCPDLSRRMPDETCWRNADDVVRLMQPLLSSYSSSFLVVAAFWVLHHMMFTYRIRGYDYGLIWRNTLFLLMLGVLPLATSAVNEYPDESLVTFLYGLTILVAGAFMAQLWFYASVRPTIVPPRGQDREAQRQEKREYDGQRAGFLFNFFASLLAMVLFSTHAFAPLPGGVQQFWLIVASLSIIAEIKGNDFGDIPTWKFVALYLGVGASTFSIQHLGADKAYVSLIFLILTLAVPVVIVLNTKASSATGDHDPLVRMRRANDQLADQICHLQVDKANVEADRSRLDRKLCQARLNVQRAQEQVIVERARWEIRRRTNRRVPLPRHRPGSRRHHTDSNRVGRQQDFGPSVDKL